MNSNITGSALNLSISGGELSGFHKTLFGLIVMSPCKAFQYRISSSENASILYGGSSESISLLPRLQVEIDYLFFFLFSFKFYFIFIYFYVTFFLSLYL